MHPQKKHRRLGGLIAYGSAILYHIRSMPLCGISLLCRAYPPPGGDMLCIEDWLGYKYRLFYGRAIKGPPVFYAEHIRLGLIKPILRLALKGGYL
jgi:hypothetical protein